MSESDASSPPQLKFHCFKCGASLKAPLRYAGRLASCPSCGAANTVPRPGAAAEREADRFAVPPRAGHEKYLDVLEASAAQVRQADAAPARRKPTPVDPTTRWVTWLLVVGNAIVALAVIGLVLWIWRPWAGPGDEPDTAEPTSDESSAPATETNKTTHSEDQGF